MTEKSEERELWRHKKSGGIYEVLHRGRMQTSEWRMPWEYTNPKGEVMVDENFTADNEPVIVYRAEDGTIWVRPTKEFRDGRFERI